MAEALDKIAKKYGVSIGEAKFHKLNEGYGWTGTFYCCDSRYWGSLEDLIKWLKQRVP